MPIELFDIDKGYTVFSKSDYKTSRHAHYAIEVVCCTEGAFNITTGYSKYTNIHSVIIPSNLPHRFSCAHAECDLLFADPLSAIGKYFMQQYKLAAQNDVIVCPPGINKLYKNGSFDISLMLKNAETIGNSGIDSRILTCIRAIDSHATDYNMTLSQLSKISFLSESRLSHLFKEQLGISVHQYILWKKILLAVSRSRQGYSLTASAHYAGFSDSSHFHKVFYKMFGIYPFFVLKT